ncbi:sigma-70 family RNA polymerase sigma factor [Pseudodesulfovibrio sp. F-1]|uniref:Sigma-70 family RNA polymerase sigma factor n=1 Tax=Pseudodesulfovibrio alkaliphilus TaxID=2661613 RepID=A0A7K1KL11_9BACT|nr:sigma-70 family RNA polymerase sigma factor [Pseudodesulfovibrio alkaliphilus]MUM76774.1 sigma-70 family RNA polymerase sigma factor [Pseudodesulfovibrio alkaliphilus]
MRVEITHTSSDEEHDVREMSYDDFFDQYSGIIFKILHSFIRCKNLPLRNEDVDDIFQEVAIKIMKYEYISRYDKEKSSLVTWVNIICRTTAIDYSRKMMRWRTGSWLGGSESCVVSEERGASLNLPPGVLTDRQEEILSLFFGEDMEAGEISDRLGISPQTVRSLKSQALERLRRHHATAAARIDDRSAEETRRTVS